MINLQVVSWQPEHSHMLHVALCTGMLLLLEMSHKTAFHEDET